MYLDTTVSHLDAAVVETRKVLRNDALMLFLLQIWLYGASVYTGSKRAVKGIAETLALELIPFTNIRVNLVCPGTTESPMLDNGKNYPWSSICTEKNDNSRNKSSRPKN